MSLRRATVRARLAAVEAELAPVAAGIEPALELWRKLYGGMSLEDRDRLRVLLKGAVAAHDAGLPVEGTPWAACLRRALQLHHEARSQQSCHQPPFRLSQGRRDAGAYPSGCPSGDGP